ncbi:RNA methyltransferase [Larkinella terrae]|uniref:TrmH family RNA methyltransferase n=1 Tax=Larkinella terrae TaxID=2025311 RepID=A0A7K0ENN0_9BACT|nr:RNA methyltransferase [Larkinella terrae]MRS63068.1 TrmH family RNA methyltransferase [Larkinella terrae]
MPRKVSLDELNRLSVEDFKTADKYPYILILDNVRSLNNVGSVFRTADAFRAEKIYLCGITGTPPHRDITKTALGATESVDWEYRADVVGLIEELKLAGWIVAAVEQAEGSLGLQDFQPDSNKKTAFVFGNEVAGVNNTVVEKADLILEIPQYGTKHSLNIAVSAGIVCWDFLTKLNKNLTE